MNTRNFSIAETVAAIGVIASLLFVGYEIRQGNLVARNEVLMSTASGWAQGTLEIAGSERISSLMARSYTESLSDFSGPERMAFGNLMLGLIKSREVGFRQLKLGISHPDDVLFPPTDNLYFTSKMQHELWQSIRGYFSEDFAVFWEQRFGYLD